MCRPHAEPSKQTQSKENSRGHPYISNSASTETPENIKDGSSEKDMNLNK